MRYIHFPYTMLIVLLMLTASCSDWLDVRPDTEIKEEVLFSTEEGYKSALTGIYKRMAKQELYGGNMSFDFMEKLVQRYDNYNSWEVSNADRAKLYEYDKDDNARYSLATIWAELYTTIANINNILKNLEEQGAEVLDATLFDIIKGEALGLRAFIYFDLLRLWGPVYSIDPGLKSLPWRDKLSSEQVPLMPAKDVIKHILADLDQAEELLQDDTLEGVVDHPFLQNRNLRMNKFAVKALKARVYLWSGDTSNAYRYANEVIETSGLSLSTDNKRDPSMTSEYLFGLYVYNMEEELKDIFPPSTSGLLTSTPAPSILYISIDNGRDVFEVGRLGVNDTRYKNQHGFLHANNRMLLRKYMAVSELSSFTKDRVPLIRLTEMYYIRGECGSLEEGVNDLNTVRKTRGIPSRFNLKADGSFSREMLIDELNKEYQKEFFGEGQWFFFLKRHNMETFHRCPLQQGMRDFYVMPIPKAEQEHGLGSRE